MALRLFLLGIVALMSFELPSRRDLETISQRSGQWWNGRVAELRRFGHELEQVFVGDPETSTPTVASIDPLAEEIAVMRADVAFDAAMDRLSTEFRADLASTEPRLPVADEAPPRLARTVEPSPAAEPSVPSCFDPELEWVGPGRVSIAADPSTSIDRLASAVKLTRQALFAWASLLPTPADESQVETR